MSPVGLPSPALRDLRDIIDTVDFRSSSSRSPSGQVSRTGVHASPVEDERGRARLRFEEQPTSLLVGAQRIHRSPRNVRFENLNLTASPR